MPMNRVIQERRRALGLTQEQVAQYLGVTTAAVSKWETGATCPDISLLPPLARLLKTDLNTLFCYHEELTAQEIRDFCAALLTTAEQSGIRAAFDQAQQMLRSYPHNEELMQTVALSLDGMLNLWDLPDEEGEALEKKVEAWYRCLSGSADEKIRAMAYYMLASRYLRRGELERAQQTLDAMPERRGMAEEYADKLMLQVNLYMKQGVPEQAAEELERALLLAVNKVQLLLLKLTEAEQAAGEKEKAGSIAKAAGEMVKLFDLWDGTAYIAPLALAAEEKDKEKTLLLLRQTLESMSKPWDMALSPLYHRIAGEGRKTPDPAMISGMVTQTARGQQYAFLREDEALRRLLEEFS